MGLFFPDMSSGLYKREYTMKTIIRMNAAGASVNGHAFDPSNARDQKAAGDAIKVALVKQG